MKLTKQEKEIIIASKIKKYANYEMITQPLITELVEMFSKDKVNFHGITVDVNEGMSGIADNIVVSMKVDEVLNLYLCKKAKKNDDLLLQMTLDKQPLLKKIENKLTGNCYDKDDALMDAILQYPGVFNFDIWILHYVRSKVNGKPLDLIKQEENKLVLTKKRKKK